MQKNESTYNYVIQIDDDDFLTEQQKLIIQKKNLSRYFDTVNKAKIALDKLRKLQEKGEKFPRYIVLDLNMPNMNGFEFIEAFYDNFYRQSGDTEFIIASSSGSVSNRLRARKYPIVKDYIVKPIPGNYIESLIKSGAA